MQLVEILKATFNRIAGIFRNALGSAPRNRALKAIAVTHAVRGESRAALRAIDNIIEISIKNEALLSVSVALSGRGAYIAAISCAEQILPLPTRLEAYAQIAFHQARSGHVRAARCLLTRVIEGVPELHLDNRKLANVLEMAISRARSGDFETFTKVERSRIAA